MTGVQTCALPIYQYHHEDYQILSSTTIHGSKSELERPRYHENQDNTPIDAPLTSESHNFWSDHWIFKFQTFSKIGSQDLSKSVKINLIHNLLKVATLKGLSMSLQGPSPRKACQGYKRPQAPLRPKKKETPLATCFLPGWILSFSPLFQTKKTHKKHIKASWFFSSPKIQGIVLIPNLLFLGPTSWIWGLGV